MIEDYFKPPYLNLPEAMLGSSYYREVLSLVDKQMLVCLYRCVSYDNRNKYYRNGILAVSNSTTNITSLAARVGVCEKTIKTSLKHLNKLGVIITIREKKNSYIVGFRINNKSKDNHWLLYHLTDKFNGDVAAYSRIKKLDTLCLDKDVRKFILEHTVKIINNQKLFSSNVKDGKRLIQYLFNIDDYFGKSAQEFGQLVQMRKEPMG